MFVPRPTPSRAAAILRDVFGGVGTPFAFRLWDGSEVRFGSGTPVAVAVIKTPEIFVDLMRDPSPGNFAEAYVASAIDLEGDLFAAMSVANVLEEFHVTLGERLRIFAALWRG